MPSVPTRRPNAALRRATARAGGRGLLRPRSTAVKASRVVGSTIPFTPDGRYIVVKDRLWRTTNPHLPPAVRQELVDRLMSARRAVGMALRAPDSQGLVEAREKVHAAKVGLGERGPVWWDDGAPDFTRQRVHKTPYAAWYDALVLSEGSD
ncbi:MAG: hypothetical protein K0Q76_1834 [Panacagrimonas sp.]|nr:hypothetical protein [Panacagrimonas sp.]MCC2656726.1 hypothetical protein [Panacagrimonas sp.]